MKNLFKKETRYSQENRPARNQLVTFSLVKELITDLFIPLKRKLKQLIKNKASCKVLRNNRYTTTVLVNNKRYIVSPMFLISENLTVEGKMIMEKLKEKINETL